MLRAILASMLALGAACSSGTPAPLASPVSAKTPRPGHVEMNVRALITMSVTGATEASGEAVETTLRIVQIEGGNNPPTLWFFSASAGEALELDDGMFALFTADLAPGTWKGPGTYELSTDSGVSLGGKSVLSSAAYVQLLRPAGEDGEQQSARFERLTEPCTLVVAPEARTGSVDCPALSHETIDESVHLTWSWTRL